MESTFKFYFSVQSNLQCHYNRADVDNESTTLTLTFQPSLETSQRQCGTVTIIDDMIGNEQDEKFSIILTSVRPEGGFGKNQSCITIKDNDSECNKQIHCHSNLLASNFQLLVLISLL